MPTFMHACIRTYILFQIYKNFLPFFREQFLVAEQEAFQKEKLTEEYNDAYPFGDLSRVIWSDNRTFKAYYITYVTYR